MLGHVSVAHCGQAGARQAHRKRQRHDTLRGRTYAAALERDNDAVEICGQQLRLMEAHKRDGDA